jgi:hypothetical protein
MIKFNQKNKKLVLLMKKMMMKLIKLTKLMI